MSKFRWVVNYTHKDCIDDLDLLRSCLREYFDNEKDAQEFKENNKHKGKPFYWQPSIHKEEEIEVVTKEWRMCK